MIFPEPARMAEELERQPDGLRRFGLSVWSNIEVSGLVPYVSYAGMQSGLRVDITYGACKQLGARAQKAGEGLIPADTGAVVVWLWLPAYSPVLTDQFAYHGADKIAWERDRVAYACSKMIKAIRGVTTAPVLWLGFEPVTDPAYGIADGGIGQRELIRGLNLFVASELQTIGNAWLMDTALCLERTGVEAFYDWTCKAVGRTPIAPAGLAAVAADVTKYVRALSGTARKCLVLDGDNTLWGGIVGEDGIDGIQIGTEYPGCLYRAFQHEVLNLYHRGVILVLCSKNNEEDVLEVLHHRPGMVLREEHFALIKANWTDKPANIRDIASQLNIGLDAMVFVDDSPFEIECVQMALRDVAVLQVAPEQGTGHARQLMDCGWFDVLTVTEEDKRRGEMYRAEGKRNAFKDALTDVEEHFGKHFDIKMEVFTPAGAELDRAAQLCQRTNQFNLTATRYTRDDLGGMHPPDYVVKGLRVSDRFGDCGMVGLAIMKITADVGQILTFLLSCRALSRGIEAAFLRELLAAVPCRRILGCYVPTTKNQQTATFYGKNGFVPIGEDKTGKWFAWERDAKSFGVPQ